VVDNVRLSLFSQDVTALNLPPWQALTGSPPQTISANTAAGLRQEAGTLPRNSGVQLTLLQQPGRADLALSAVVVPSPVARVFDVGSAVDAMEMLRQMAEPWLPGTLDIGRLAIGINLMWETPDVEAARAVLFNRIRDFTPRPTIEDFALQVNRPRVSTISPGLKINRLVQWTTAMVGSMPAFSPPAFLGLPGVAFPQAALFPGIPVALCIADVNTDAAKSIVAAQISPIFAELVAMVLEIETSGDIP
jgi:hypothetical protein